MFGKRRIVIAVLLVLILCFLSAVVLMPQLQSRGPTDIDITAASLFAANEGNAPAQAPGAGYQAVDYTSNAGGTAEQQPRGRIVLMNASLRLVVSDAQAKQAEIMGMTSEMGGWVVSSNSSQVSTGSGTEAVRVSISIRVPAERLNEALDRVKAGVVSVEGENITGQDVTQEYVDLTSRIANLEAAEAQLQEIMEAATRTQDVLDVYNELIRIRGEIETARGRIQYFDEASAFSSISIELIPEEVDRPIEIAGWSPTGIARDALQALVNVLQLIVNFAIWLVVFVLPLALLFGVPAIVVWRLAKRYNRRTVPAPSAPTVTPKDVP